MKLSSKKGEKTRVGGERGREGKKRGFMKEEETEERVHCFCGRIPCIT